MKQAISKYWPAGLTLLFGVGVWIFWAFPFVAVLSYMEQYQLFLATWGYFVERIGVPGGLAEYVGEWVTQWNVYPALGGLMCALLFVAIQLLTWLVAKRLGAQREHYALTFIPAIGLWGLMTDGDTLMAFGVSLVGVLGLMLAYEAVGVRWGRIVAIAVGSAVGYLLLGPSVAVAVAYVVVREVVRERSAWSVGLCVGAALWLCVVVILSSYIAEYPLDWLVRGPGYQRYPMMRIAGQVVVMLLAGLTPIVVAAPKACKWFVSAAEAALVVVVGTCWIIANYDAAEQEAYEYDYLVRNERWDDIIALAESRQPTQVSSTCSLNLALSQKGLLAERMFDFYQNGAAGLFPRYKRNMQDPILLGEIFFRLGMINGCERYIYEAQESITTLRKSGRLTQRIAECEIVNGEYAVARKLLHFLEKSPTYRGWARERLTLIEDDQAVNNHPVYGYLRQVRQHVRDFFINDDLATSLAILYSNNRQNRMAFEYLMCYHILDADLKKFARAIPLFSGANYGRIPKAFQEVMIGCWLQDHKDMKGFPFKTDGYVVQNTIDCIRVYAANHDDPQLGSPQYESNAMSYILRRKQAIAAAMRQSQNKSEQ